MPILKNWVLLLVRSLQGHFFSPKKGDDPFIMPIGGRVCNILGVHPLGGCTPKMVHPLGGVPMYPLAETLLMQGNF